MRTLSTATWLLIGLVVGAGPAAAQKRQRDLITREEIAKLEGAQSAYDVVRRIHPEWMRGQGARSMRSTSEGVQVYLDDRKEGGVDMLRNIDAAAIGEIRYLDGPEAEARYGQNHSAGAILVTLRMGTRKDSLPPIKPPQTS